MSSYDSTRSGYPPHPQYPQQQPPYPTTPAAAAAPPSQQPTNYFPPIPEQQPLYSSSPISPYNSEPVTSMPQPHIPSHRRTSSSSSYNSQRPPHLQPSAPAIPIRQPNPPSYRHHDQHYGELDPETEREYERRYARERELERRPTLGGSVLSMVGKVGGLLGGDRR